MNEHESFINDGEGLKLMRLDIVKLINHSVLLKRVDYIYYCERDDIVFLPGEMGFEKLQNINQLLERR